MYSVVMMMAMTGAPEMPAFGRRNGCDGGCRGATAGCCGYVDNCGCQGGRGGRRHRGCGGGCGGYTAGCGCCGYANNCCQTSCGCCGQMANCCNTCNTCNTCSSCGGCGTACAGCGGAPMMAAPASTPAPPAMPPKDGKPTAMLSAPAALVVSLPADATLKINGVATTQISGVRQFATPTLTAGQNFYYTLTAEVVRDGQTLTSVQSVTVRAGETTNVSIPADQFGAVVAMK